MIRVIREQDRMKSMAAGCIRPAAFLCSKDDRDTIYNLFTSRQKLNLTIYI